MSDWNPVNVEQEILATVNEIAEGIATARDTYAVFLEAERAYKRAYALAYINHAGPAHEKRYWADLNTQAEAEARDVADVAYTYARDRNKSLSSKLDAIRSVGASVRQAYANAGRGEW